ncbi:CYTH and CHAD domain-containing protein [Magnetospirillum sulfuroxidans]|uniref:CHAD domain-containing protein n=1 Tax=Magnetospirillum sulfuroxidans TaxID=611300 RepID=A0ABS5IGH6_9PROT|nr:CYTH and CHAD domain-containing protein [Magnetospirillum sulfuroxidans]MBR9973521.1 CHAD domain-containing protein [Magnetospirillum sulfuroxidans]
MDSTETELKLAVDAALLDRIPRLPAIARNKTGRAKTQQLCSTYYDTPEMELQKAGITLRLRQGGGLWLQTVKNSGDRTAGLFERREWEIDVPLGQIHLPHLLATGLSPFRQQGLPERLRPVFTTEIRRTLHILATPDWEIELALDRGEIIAGTQRSAVSEIEMELRRGPSLALFDMAQAIAAALPCRLQSQSKSDRGFGLAGNGELKPVKAAPLALTADMKVASAFQVIARNCLHHLLANEAALRGNHAAEAVHQARVALRRLRSAIKVFKPLLAGPQLPPLRQELRWLLAHLGPARDGDVFLAEILKPVLCRHPDAPALPQLYGEWQEQRDRDFAAAVAAVDDNRFTLLLLRLGHWVTAAEWHAPALADTRLDDFARRVLKRTHHRLIKAGGNNLAHLPTEELHQVRIIGKQMRYAGEFFASLYPRSASKPFLNLLADLQENLGGLNDLAVAGPRLARSHHRGDWAWAAGLICGWHETRRPGLLRQAQATWKLLRKATPFWR